MKQPVYHKKLQKLSFPIQALLIANLLPLFGVVFLGWDAAAIVLLYRHRHLVARQSAPRWGGSYRRMENFAKSAECDADMNPYFTSHTDLSIAHKPMSS